MFSKRIIGSLLAAALSGAPLLSAAAQAPPNEKQMVPLQYLVGTWHCDWKSQNGSGHEDQVFQPALDGAWLEEKELIDVNGRQTVASIHYTGYDPKSKSYVHMGPDANGSYEVAHSPDAVSWSAADGSFIHHKVSDTRREMTETDQVGTKTSRISMICVR